MKERQLINEAKLDALNEQKEKEKEEKEKEEKEKERKKKHNKENIEQNGLTNTFMYALRLNV